MLLSMDIPHTASEKNKNAIWKTYPDNKRYLSSPETKECRKRPNTFALKRSGVRSWGITEEGSIFLINCIIIDQNAKSKNSRFPIQINILRVELRRTMAF